MNLFLHLIFVGLFASNVLSILDVKNLSKRHIWRSHHNSQAVDEPRYVQTKGGRSDSVIVNPSTSEPRCSPYENGIKPHPSSCQMYVSCVNGRVFVDTCSQGFLFNDATKECDFASKVTCPAIRQNARLYSAQHTSYDDTAHYTDTDREVISHFKCPHEGIFEHPHDCTKFIQCAHSGVFVQSCGPGTMFNPSLLVCDWPKNVNCNKNVNANIQSEKSKSEFPRNHEGQDRRPAGTDYDYDFDVRMSDTDSRTINNNNDDQQHRGVYSTSAVHSEHSQTFNQQHSNPTQTYSSNSQSGRRVNDQYPQQSHHQTSSSTTNAHYPSPSNQQHTPERDLLPPLQAIPQHISETTLTNQQGAYSSTSDSRNFQTAPQTRVQYPPQTSPQYTSSTRLQPQQHPDLISTHQQGTYPSASQSRSFHAEPSEQEILTSVQPLPNSRTQQSGHHVHSSPSYSKTKVYSSQQSNPSSSNTYRGVSTNEGTYHTQPLNQQIPTSRHQQNFYETMDLLDTYANYETTRRVQDQNGRANVMTVDRSNANRDHEIPIYNRPARPISTRFASSSEDLQTEASEHSLHLNDALKLMLSPYTKDGQLGNEEVDEMKTKIMNTATDEAEHLIAFVDITTEETDQEVDKEEQTQDADSNNPQLDGVYDDSHSNFFGDAPTPDTESLPDSNSQTQTKTVRFLHRSNVLLTSEQSDKYDNSERSETGAFCSSGFDCGNGVCLSSAKICDGRDDCGNRLDEKNCKDISYDVRFASGHPHAGELEVKIFDKWGSICGDGIGLNEANALCGEAGYPLGAGSIVRVPFNYTHQSQEFVRKRSNYVLDELHCSGNATSLKDCEFNGWDVRDCVSDWTVGLNCQLPDKKCKLNYWLCDQSEECIPTAFLCDAVKDCTDGSDESAYHCNSTTKYRLGNPKSDHKEGRVEVRYKGIWGTVCDDDFGENEAKVFCRSLGYDGAAAVIKEFTQPGDGLIWLDQVSCVGNETSLDQCTHFEWGENNCNHTEDVNVRCFEQEVPTSQKLTLREPKTDLTEINEIPHSSRSDSDHCGQIRVAADAGDYNNQPVFKVIEGGIATKGHHPWQATLRVRGRNGKSSHWCGAVLISQTHVLTAAHCLIGFAKNAYFIRLGDHHSETPEDTEVEIFIEDWHIHETFRKGHLMNNDIALIKLKSAVKFTDYIQPICLPAEDTEYTVGKNCTISGWGSTQYGKSTPSLHLRSASIPIMSEEICKQPHNYGNSIQSGMFCAGIEGNMIDACDGDSGGPFVCQNDDDNGYHLLYGIISWGQRCGDRNKPGVYTKVAEYLPWIQEKMLL